ncbi:MAG: DUF3592 domain-containing protein [Actinomycetes bacterium]
MEILAAVACLLGGLFFAFLVYGNLNYERHRARRGAVVTGRIVDARWDMNTAGAIYQGPVVEFVDHQGRTRRFEQRSGTSFSAPQVGLPVQVWYDPDNPDERPVLHQDGVSKAFPVIFGLVALGLLVVGGVLLAVGL